MSPREPTGGSKGADHSPTSAAGAGSVDCTRVQTSRADGLLPLLVIALDVFLITTAVNLQVPLYGSYAAAAGYGSGRTALVFAAYVAGLLPVLIALGGISDRIGRKPVLLAALACSLLATLAMALHPTMDMLFFARVVQGVSVALCMGAATAYLAELYPRSSRLAPAAVALASALGFGSGALLTGLLLLHAPSLCPPSYWLTVAALASGLALGFPLLPQSAPASAAGTPLLRLPFFPPAARLAHPAIALCWSVSGLVIAILPGELRRRGLEPWAGPMLFLVNSCGAAAQAAVPRIGSRRAMTLGCAALPVGFLALTLGARAGNLALLLMGAGIAGGAGYGLVYRGGLDQVVLAAQAQRARAVTGYFLSAYLGFGLPCVFVGWLAETRGIPLALALFGLPVATLSAWLALAYARKQPGAREA